MYFRYKAYEEGGSVREGIIEGTVAEDVRAEIRNGGLHLVSLSEIKKRGRHRFYLPHRWLFLPANGRLLFPQAFP